MTVVVYYWDYHLETLLEKLQNDQDLFVTDSGDAGGLPVMVKPRTMLFWVLEINLALDLVKKR